MNNEKHLKKYQLSPVQQGMLYDYLSKKDSGNYIQQMCYDLKENLNLDVFRDSWIEVINNHDIFKTSFRWKNLNEPMQYISENISIPFDYRDLSELETVEKLREVDDFLIRDRHRGFNLNKTPLLRFTLFRLEKSHFKLIWSFHHIIIDGRSHYIITKEFFKKYNSIIQGERNRNIVTNPYCNYIDWFYRQDHSDAKDYWRSYLKGFSAPTPIFNFIKSDNNSSNGLNEIEVKLSSEDTALLTNIAQKSESSLNTVVQAAWGLLLSHYGAVKDVVFGTVRSGRYIDLKNIKSMVGLFINTLPVRIKLQKKIKLTEFLKDVRSRQIIQRKFDHTPLPKVHKWSDVSTEIPLFESYIVFDNKKLSSAFQEEGGGGRHVKLHEQSNYPLVLHVLGGHELSVTFAFNSNQINYEVINRIAGHLKMLLNGFIENDKCDISDYKIVTKNEKNQLIQEWNSTDKKYLKNICLHQLFESQVDKTPNRIAIIYNHQKLTYSELDQKANQLAHYLQKKGIGKESLVGVCMERSMEMVISLYGILKAGGAYVPLDPEYPAERLGFMIEDTCVSVVLTQKHLAGVLPDNSYHTVCLDSEWNKISECIRSRSLNQNSDDNLAYVIYTSGSTGKPKGVMNEHRNICNRLFWMQDEYKLTEEDRVLQKTPYSFDVSVWEFFWPLLNGTPLIIAPPSAHMDTRVLVDLIIEYKITTIHFVPSMLQLFLEGEGIEKCISLKRVICSGEALTYDLQNRFFKRMKAELHNLYGPTEAAVDVTYWECKKDHSLKSVPIGRPVANTQMYILDSRMQPVPAGVPGELHIGGVQVARGYINRPDLTKEKFIDDPFSNRVDARLYKTGDLARFLNDGVIEYIGRVDFQVKIRGLRIELSEIEYVLSEHPSVRETVVAVSGSNFENKRLIGYVVPHQDQKISVETLRGFLMKKLPGYMVPDLFLVLESFPLTSSGKIDRKALPEPDNTRPDLDRALIPPSNSIEEKLADIWCNVLNLEDVGVDDNFFSLGGNSLMIILIMSQINTSFSFDLSVTKIIQYPTIRTLGKYIEQGNINDKSLEEYRRRSNLRTKLRVRRRGHS